jgi:hypothetical protein
MRYPVAVIQWFSRALEAAHRLFGSTTNTQMAEVLLLLILAMIAWTLVIVPGDQTGDGLRGVIRWWLN